MKIAIITILLICGGCASERANRKISSVIYSSAENDRIDFKQSRVQTFPSTDDSYLFYVHLKNKFGIDTDCDISEISLKTIDGKSLEFKYEMLQAGRFYLRVLNSSQVRSDQISIFIQGKLLNQGIPLKMPRPDLKNSSLKILRNENNIIVFQLRLADSRNNLIDTINDPEIIMEGLATMEGLRRISKGIWEYSVVYPEDNQIMYFSVRSQGVYFHNLLRYQHVEK